MSFAVLKRGFCAKPFLKKFFVFLRHNFVIIREYRKKLFCVLFYFIQINWGFQPWFGDFLFLIVFQFQDRGVGFLESSPAFFLGSGHTSDFTVTRLATNTM